MTMSLCKCSEKSNRRAGDLAAHPMGHEGRFQRQNCTSLRPTAGLESRGSPRTKVQSAAVYADGVILLSL